MVAQEESSTAPEPTRRGPPGSHQRVLAIEGCVDRAEIPALCERIRRLLARPGVEEVICDLRGLVRSDLVAVDALARMQLIAHRCGGQIKLRGATPELLDLFRLLCLRRTLPCVGEDAGEDGDEPCH